MDALETRLAAEEIKRLKFRYMRCIDTKGWEEMETHKDRPSIKLTASRWSSGGASSIEA